MSESLTAPASTSRPLLPILMVNFIGTMGYSIILPFLVFLVVKFGGNEFIYGIMGATYSAFQLVGAPILGNWSDRFGRRKILLLSQAGTLLAWILFLVALLLPTKNLVEVDNATAGIFIITLPLLILFLARALDGLTGGNVSVANAYLADISTEKNRKSNFGKMAASANMGFIIGPTIAGLLGSTALGEIVPVFAAMLVSIFALIVIAFRLPESKPLALTKPADEERLRKTLGQEHKECYKMKCKEDPKGFWQMAKRKNVGYILIMYFLIFLAFNFFYVSFPIHAQKALEWDVFQLGIFFSLLSGIMVLVQGSVLGKVSSRFSEGQLIIAGNLLLCVSFILVSTNQLVLVYASAVFFSAGNGIMWPSFLSVLAYVAGDKYQGAIQGYASSAGSLASIVGLVSGGVIYSIFGAQTFWIPAVLILVIAVVSVRILTIMKNPSSE
ncbi:MAG: MFS transporter [Bacteroidota bacterium]